LRKEKPGKRHWSFSYLIRELKKKKRSTFLEHFDDIASYFDCNKLGMVSSPRQQQAQQQQLETFILRGGSKDRSRQQQE